MNAILNRLPLFVLLALPMPSPAIPALYDFNFDTGSGFIIGQFVADIDSVSPVSGNRQATVTSFTLIFDGVLFDTGPLAARAAGAYSDFTGLAGTVTSGTTPFASLFLNTCGYIACQATWANLPNLGTGGMSLNSSQPVAVTRVVPEPGSLVLCSLSLLGLAFARRPRRRADASAPVGSATSPVPVDNVGAQKA